MIEGPDHPMVRLNEDGAEEIATLYDVSLEMAQNVVQYRKGKGPLRGPDDLEQVPGFHRNLALVLSPHIDWELEEKTEEEGTRRRYWWDGVRSILLSLLGIWMYVSVPTRVWRVYLFFFDVGILSVVIGTAAQAVGSLTLSGSVHRYASFFDRLAKRVMALSLLSIFGLHVMSSEVLGTGSWPAAFSRDYIRAVFPSILAALGIGFATRFGTGAVIKTKPDLSRNNTLVALAFTGYLAALLAFMVPYVPPSYSWLAFLPLLALALLFILDGSYRLTSGTFEVNPLPRLSIYHSDDELGEREKAAWGKWLNTRLPSPEQQRKLKAVLDASFPSTRRRTWLGILLVGVGGWLLLTTLGAVLEVLVQRGITPLLGSP